MQGAEAVSLLISESESTLLAQFVRASKGFEPGVSFQRGSKLNTSEKNVKH